MATKKKADLKADVVESVEEEVQDANITLPESDKATEVEVKDETDEQVTVEPAPQIKDPIKERLERSWTKQELLDGSWPHWQKSIIKRGFPNNRTYTIKEVEELTKELVDKMFM